MTEEKKYKMLVFGPPASGKGTQVDFLVDKLNLPVLATGQLLREEMKKDTPRGQRTKKQMDSGAIVDDDIVLELIKEKLNDPEFNSSYISESFPRRKTQAEFLDNITKLTHVLELEVSDQEVMDRLGGRRYCEDCNKAYHIKFDPPKEEGICDVCHKELIIRSDDKPEVLKERLKAYYAETKPLSDYYTNQNILTKINGEQSIEDVRKEIFSKLNI
jgi:adenylate kinase